MLIAHERTKTLEPGWYIGKISVFGDGVTPAWKKVCPSANFLVKYTKKETGSTLDGNSALELAVSWRHTTTAATSGGSCSTQSRGAPSELVDGAGASAQSVRGSRDAVQSLHIVAREAAESEGRCAPDAAQTRRCSAG